MTATIITTAPTPGPPCTPPYGPAAPSSSNITAANA